MNTRKLTKNTYNEDQIHSMCKDNNWDYVITKGVLTILTEKESMEFEPVPYGDETFWKFKK